MSAKCGLRQHIRHAQLPEPADPECDTRRTRGRGSPGERAGGREKIFYRYLHMTSCDGQGRLAWRADRRRAHDYAHILAKLQELETLHRRSHQTCSSSRGRSRVLTDEKVDAFVRRLPHARRETIPDAGHNVQEDTPRELADAIARFVADGGNPFRKNRSTP